MVYREIVLRNRFATLENTKDKEAKKKGGEVTMSIRDISPVVKQWEMIEIFENQKLDFSTEYEQEWRLFSIKTEDKEMYRHKAEKKRKVNTCI